MARIRTIKPEFPQSESMGRVSRDARLLFILLWTLADDSGRLRGNSRMLASLLYPYDDDAKTKISKWIDELMSESCIVCYEVDGNSYVEIRNWLQHQKIDKPSASKIPAPRESSRILANPRESSALDQGSRTKDQGEDRDRKPETPVVGRSVEISEMKLPKGFDTQEVRDALTAWSVHFQKKKHRAFTDMDAQNLIMGRMSAGWDAAKLARSIYLSASNDWENIRDCDEVPRNNQNKPQPPIDTRTVGVAPVEKFVKPRTA